MVLQFTVLNNLDINFGLPTHQLPLVVLLVEVPLFSVMDLKYWKEFTLKKLHVQTVFENTVVFYIKFTQKLNKQNKKQANNWLKNWK